MRKKKKPKVYIAILNHGWIRREIAFPFLYQVYQMRDIDIMLENLAQTYDHPICSNRNKIVKRFLKTDCDYLLMLDNDVIPSRNPVRFVFAEKDVIGFPAKVRQSGRVVNWTAYMKHPYKEGYLPVDFSRIDSNIDFLQVDIVGTGCILIKRKVLEKIKAPFLSRFNEDGIKVMGTDFAFCERVKENGFEIYTAVKAYCEHIKQFGLLDYSGYDDSDNRDISPARYGMVWGEYAIQERDWKFIRETLEKEKVKSILEFGCGLSSLLMSEKYTVLSFETEKKFKKAIEKKTINNKLMIELWDGKKLNREINKCDVVFIDAPRGKINGGIGREGAYRYAVKNYDKILLHDGGRGEELVLKDVYMQDFKLIAKNGHHKQRTEYWRRRK